MIHFFFSLQLPLSPFFCCFSCRRSGGRGGVVVYYYIVVYSSFARISCFATTLPSAFFYHPLEFSLVSLHNFKRRTWSGCFLYSPDSVTGFCLIFSFATVNRKWLIFFVHSDRFHEFTNRWDLFISMRYFINGIIINSPHLSSNHLFSST